eukprot:jgi/Galph1/4806/GphlegSOOS_G3486.1
MFSFVGTPGVSSLLTAAKLLNCQCYHNARRPSFIPKNNFHGLKPLKKGFLSFWEGGLSFSRPVVAIPQIAMSVGSSEATDLSEDVEPPVVTLVDTKYNRELPCYVEQEFEHEGKILVTNPYFFASYERGEEGDWELTPLEDEQLVDRLFPYAFQTLTEREIFLNRSAVTLTIEGELPEIEDGEEDVFVEAEEDVRLVGTFHDGQNENEYYIFANMDPFLLLGKKSGENVVLLGNGEFDKIAPVAEKIMEDILKEKGYLNECLCFLRKSREYVVMRKR